MEARPPILQRVSQRAIGAVTPHVPIGVKRSVKRRIPKRYWRYLDPDWHRKAIGGLWDELGQLQFDYLVERGLEPHHYLLDVGCGGLRAGVRFMAYLEPGHYYGVEKNPALLRQARDVELRQDGLGDKRPVLVEMEDFDFARLGRQFDYAIAQSVFTHLPLNQIVRCLVNMEQALVPGGKFFATFYENPGGKRNLGDVVQTEGVVTHFDRDFFHYDFASFEWACGGLALDVEYLGDWNNPRNQKMMVFTRG